MCLAVFVIWVHIDELNNTSTDINLEQNNAFPQRCVNMFACVTR